MTLPCERCGHELREDEDQVVRSVQTGRPTCPRGGPHKLPALPSDDDIWKELL